MQIISLHLNNLDRASVLPAVPQAALLEWGPYQMRDSIYWGAGLAWFHELGMKKEAKYLSTSVSHSHLIYDGTDTLPMLAPHMDLCVIEYSLGDAPTALKHGDEACLDIWHLTWKLSTASPNLSCELTNDFADQMFFGNMISDHPNYMWKLTYII